MLDKLQQYFGFSEFRPGQREVVESIVEGNDTVALMPTGGGKSLCFQLPAVLLPKLTIVVSPLIALMKDQVDGLVARGLPAAFINSSLSGGEYNARVREIKEEKIKVLYVAPERFRNDGFTQLLSELEVGLLAVDEAHCVSQWGHDFRPDYLGLRRVIEGLRHRPIVAAFTATATPEVKEDIIRRLGLRSPRVFVRGFDRPNLRFFARSDLSEREREEEMVRIVQAMLRKSGEGSGVVYCLTRKYTEEAAEILNEEGIKAVAYHAGLQRDERTKIQQDFMENEYQVIVATVAFGMGVDKADIRFVIHMGMPNSLEGYYQEAGRAGRDSELAYCVLLHSGKDTSLHHFFITKSREEMTEQNKSRSEIKQVLNVKYRQLEKMLAYAQSVNCRRRMILEYFGDESVRKMNGLCQGCDVCLDYKWPGDTSPLNNFVTFESPSAKRRKKKSGLADTVQESVKLYQQGKSTEQIAKIRSLAQNTVLGHLLKWYALGGEFRIEDYVSKEVQSKILQAMSRAEDITRLAQIKEQLPESITYEQIKVVVAKIQRVKL